MMKKLKSQVVLLSILIISSFLFQSEAAFAKQFSIKELREQYKSESNMQMYSDEFIAFAKKRAKQGDTNVQVLLGNLYSQGIRVPQNYSEALKWYKMAAAKGDALGQERLGTMYLLGRGVDQNYSEALKLLRSSAEQGEPFGQLLFGLMHAKGLGTTKNDSEAFKWLTLAAEQGDEDVRARALAYLRDMDIR